MIRIGEDTKAKKADSAWGHRRAYLALKRTFDVVFSALALVLLCPLILMVAAAVKLTSRGPVFYRHLRMGKNGKPIKIIKFRTMILNADRMTDMFTDEQRDEWMEYCKVADDPRITGLGKWLRRTSIDEVPQFLNIIKGEMSLIGPRPVTREEAERYGEQMDKFLSMTPGLTGYWQAYARGECTYEQRMEMELYYIDHASALEDIKIFFATFGRVLRCTGD